MDGSSPPHDRHPAASDVPEDPLVKCRKGLTLIELVVGSTLLGLVTFTFYRLFALTNKGMENASRSAVLQGSITEVSSLLQRFLASGDSRFFAFSGRGALGDRTLFRLLTPLPGRCADMTTGCAADVAFLYAHYDRSVSPAVSAICRFSPAEWLIDVGNDTYGPAQYVAGQGFAIVAPVAGPPPTYPVGPIPVVANGLLALANPPNFTVWRALGPPVRQPVTEASGVFTPVLPADCAANLRRNGAGVPFLADLYRVPIEPLILNQFTNGAGVTAMEIASSEGRFPMRLFSTSFRSFGRLPGNPSRFVLRGCRYTGAQLDCPDRLPFDVPGVLRVRVFEGFRTALVPNDTPEFEVVGPGGVAGANCATPTLECRTLVAANPAAIPVLATSAETYAQPSSAAFSFLKQDLIRTLKVRLDLAQKQEEFRVNFP